MPDHADSPESPLSPESHNLPQIYVVNSDEDFLEMIGSLLEDARVRVRLEQIRPNIAVTVDNLRAAKPDLLILDVVPYRNDARLLLERIAEHDDLHNMPIMLASTSSGAAEKLAEQYGNQICDVLPKPFNLDDFYLKLSRVLVGVRLT